MSTPDYSLPVDINKLKSVRFFKRFYRDGRVMVKVVFICPDCKAVSDFGHEIAKGMYDHLIQNGFTEVALPGGLPEGGAVILNRSVFAEGGAS